MKVVKCINNNVAICLDDDNNELIEVTDPYSLSEFKK